ncbi:glycoside hydrolase family 3 N-terminal domain-containing protein [Salinibacterium sp. SWN1162]|uniref:beta-xylosidase/alpha-l-arabinosidase n=1 Tax=Salinibacterium sp. SWN1162 TaxID=2792053 RepID=UPI0018CDC02F|nr:glycoside hydrolase family 3 N-terminal domain-containing protein [Salinibacterium sp. SWN1162]MBH0009892.1 glycoside hydrolase family 3 C-terminal domain-containing protein [Salinibacterium sp. SWN1162]
MTLSITTPADASETNDQVENLIAQMTLEEKLAQLVGIWVGAGVDGESVAPMQSAQEDGVDDFNEFSKNGLGHLTRVFGTVPVSPAAGRSALGRTQRWLRDNTRLGIPAIAHEECLTGLAAWQATTFPTPLAWGATFDPALIEEMGHAIGESMAKLGVHQGLAPVLDVIRDVRWGRVEECIAEDPFVVGELGSAYVRGLQSTGVIATLKHFVGYSNSRAGRNLAPVHAGPREVADVLLVPFEMAVLDAGVGSVMHSYAEIDGVPVASDPTLLTDLLRDRWGFEGTVVADYFGVAFLESLHQVASDLGDAAAQALTAGVDVELPTGKAYLAPLAAKVHNGEVDITLVDRALRRVLTQKQELGLLDPESAAFSVDATDDEIDLDPPQHRAIAAAIAEKSITLLSNGGILPLAPDARIAVVGPNAHRTAALFGCYSFTNHVLGQHPDVAMGIEVETVLESLSHDFSGVLGYAQGCAVDDDDTSRIAEAVELATTAEVAVVAVGDHAGLFGRGTSGEGCDRDSLELPGVQRQLVEAVLDTGTPVVLVVISGRPYAIDWAAARGAAIVQAFFPGEEGAKAISGAISGRINPSGRLAVSVPRSAGSQPYSYLHPRLGEPSEVSNLTTAPAFPFGFGLSYTSFRYSDAGIASETIAADGRFDIHLTVTNTGTLEGDEVVQVYAHDVVSSVTRPTRQLVAFTRVTLQPGESRTLAMSIPTTRIAFSDRSLTRIVEPGDVRLWLGSDCETEAVPLGTVTITGPVHAVTTDDSRNVDITVVT